MRTVVVLVLALVAGGCAEQESSGRSSGAWDRLTPAPLSPRESTTALSIDGEAIFVGGSDADPCPPSADCAAPAAAPLRDGAAFDPGRREWTPIADAPVGFSFADSAVIDGTAYLLVPGEPGRPNAPAAFLRYRRAEDRWTRLPLPPNARRRGLVATGDRVIAYTQSDEGGVIPDVAFDPGSGEWMPLPDDPLPRSFGRTMAWSGRELVLFAQELVPQPGSQEPSVVIAASFDPDRDAWRRLPDSEILGGGARWFAHGDQLILPALGSADGGEVGNWGRPYPNGGILDLDGDRWLPLPDPPAGEDEFSAGVVAGDRSDVFGETGWILDAVAEDWVPIPPLRTGNDMVTGSSVAAAGRDVIAFGGVRWNDGEQIQLLDETWTWAVP
jgi:hypothetical protein